MKAVRIIGPGIKISEKDKIKSYGRPVLDIPNIKSPISSITSLSNNNHQNLNNETLSNLRTLSKNILNFENDDEKTDDWGKDNYEDSRAELKSIGHNLTSVLMNPRETVMESIMDEFELDQSVVIDMTDVSANNSPMNTSLSSHGSTHNSLHGMSSYVNGSLINNTSIMQSPLYPMWSISSHGYASSTSSSMHGFSSHNSNPLNGISSSLLYPPTSATDMEQLVTLVAKMQRIYKVHVQGSHSPRAVGLGLTSPSTSLAANEDLQTCFKNVPAHYFKQDFTLQHNAELFNQTLGVVKGIVEPGQQEKLSHHLDLVEMALLKQIWSRSPAFFRALDDLKGLQSKVIETNDYLTSLRKNMQSVDQDVAVSAMKIPKMFRRQQNESKLYDKLVHMQNVLHGRQIIRELLDGEEYIIAMEHIVNCKKTYHEHLTDLTCMKKVGVQLDEFDSLVSEILCNQFISLAITFEEHEYNDKKELVSIGNSKDCDSLQQVLTSLLAVGRLQPALMMYKSRICEALRLIIRTCVLEYLNTFDPSMALQDMTNQDFSSGESETPFAQRVREMSSDGFVSCLTLCFEHVLIALKRTQSVHMFISDILHIELTKKCGKSVFICVAAKEVTLNNNDTTGEKDHHNTGSSVSNRRTVSSSQVVEQNMKQNINNANNMNINNSNSNSNSNSNNNNSGNISGLQTNIDLTQLQSLSKTCIGTACDLSQRSIQQLISLRRDTTSHLNLENVKYLWEISIAFIVSLENISGASAYDMRRCLATQVKEFLSCLHDNMKRQLHNTLDNERWVHCDTNVERQHDIDQLASGRAFLQKKKVVSVSVDSSTVDMKNGTISDSKVNNAVIKKKETRPTNVEGSFYKASWSSLFVTEICLQYLNIAVSFPTIGTDVITKTAEILRLFDKRTRELILAAEAIESAARLKSISAKHLAITAQSLGLILALLPHFRAALLAQLPPTHHMQLTELDRVANLLIEHHGLIVDKLVEIAAYAVDSSSNGLRKVDWDRFQGQCDYFVEVTRNVSSLHRVLQENLPSEQIQDIFSRIFASLCRKMPAHFEDIMPDTHTGKQRILDEVTHLVSSLIRLKQVESSSLNILEESFRRKYEIAK